MARSLDELERLMRMMKEFGVVVFKETSADGSSVKLVSAPAATTENRGIWVDEPTETETEESKAGFNIYDKLNLRDYK